MGAFVASSRWIAGHLGETVGYKVDLALTREEIAAHLSDVPDFRDAGPFGRGPVGTCAIRRLRVSCQ